MRRLGQTASGPSLVLAGRVRTRSGSRRCASHSRIIAPFSLATDLVDDRALRIGSVLRMADHHLNLRFQGLVPHVGVEPFCVSQACQTFGLDNLKSVLESQVQQCRVSGEVAAFVPLMSEMWVEALGSSSISYGHAFSLGDQVLGLATRVFVRLDTSTGKLLQLSEEEREGSLQATRHSTWTPTAVEKLAAPDPEEDMDEVFSVRIGPQHCNNMHVDHAALADLVLQGLSLQNYSLLERKLSMQYMHPGEIGRTVSCRVHSQRPVVVMYQNDDGPRERLLAIGRMSDPARESDRQL